MTFEGTGTFHAWIPYHISEDSFGRCQVRGAKPMLEKSFWLGQVNFWRFETCHGHSKYTIPHKHDTNLFNDKQANGLAAAYMHAFLS